MIGRILFTFILFAALAYYFNIDVRAVVDKSGVPNWLIKHGVTVNSTPSATTTN